MDNRAHLPTCGPEAPDAVAGRARHAHRLSFSRVDLPDGPSDPTPRTRAPEQLADGTCSHLLPGVRRLRCGIRSQLAVPRESAKGRFPRGAFSAGFAGRRPPGRLLLSHHRRGIPPDDLGDHHRRGVGEFGLGQLLDLGSQGDVVPDRMADLRCLPACPDRQGLEGETNRMAFRRWIRRHLVLLPGGEFTAFRPAQLRHGLGACPRAPFSFVYDQENARNLERGGPCMSLRLRVTFRQGILLTIHGS